MQEDNQHPYWFGIDVSKDSFEAAGASILRAEKIVRPEGGFPASAEGVEKFLAWARKTAGAFSFGVAMETTGVYSRRLAGLLAKADPALHVAVCDAASVSLYARSFTEAKSDRADAAFIARYAVDRNPAAARRPGQAEAKLKEAVRARHRLVRHRMDLGNSMESIEDAETRRIQKTMLAQLDKGIARLDARIRALVDSDGTIKAEVRRMATAPGVGELSAAIIRAELGSMKNYGRRQISAMSGVCPVNRLSGTSVHSHAMSHRSSKLLRQILYLDSFQAIKKIPSMAEFHERMLKKPESSKMGARCACMRKLLLILHAMVVNEKDFDANYRPQKNVKNLQNPA